MTQEESNGIKMAMEHNENSINYANFPTDKENVEQDNHPHSHHSDNQQKLRKEKRSQRCRIKTKANIRRAANADMSAHKNNKTAAETDFVITSEQENANDGNGIKANVGIVKVELRNPDHATNNSDNDEHMSNDDTLKNASKYDIHMTAMAQTIT